MTATHRFAAWLGRTIDAFCTLQRIQFAAPWQERRAGR
jgi:hypothetical protein